LNGAGQTQHEASARAPQRFPRTAKLLKHAAFEKVYKEGRRIFSGSLTAFYRDRRGWGLPSVARWAAPCSAIA
jgi:hypothetical protein